MRKRKKDPNVTAGRKVRFCVLPSHMWNMDIKMNVLSKPFFLVLDKMGNNHKSVQFLYCSLGLHSENYHHLLSKRQQFHQGRSEGKSDTGTWTAMKS